MGHQEKPFAWTPLDWTPPDELRLSVEKVIHHVTFSETDVALKDVRGMVYYGRSVISFDCSLKPHEVHPAFWSAGMTRVYVVSVIAARSHEETWERCYEALYSEALKPHGIQDVIVKFANGSAERVYLPHFARIGGSLMEVKDGKYEIELLRARRQVLESSGVEEEWLLETHTRISNEIRRREIHKLT
ncbi:hypothetical protein GGR51DRAFT_557788 [Nemania sp. FL0031]|nr:hypothetical protein GGR51DRAFT_557788 [Nemania sp. FL0031]